MNMQGDDAREDLTNVLCEKLRGKIKKHPEATKALKEIGVEMLNELPNIPKWAWGYHKLFSK